MLKNELVVSRRRLMVLTRILNPHFQIKTLGNPASLSIFEVLKPELTMKRTLLLILFLPTLLFGQLRWSKDGNAYYKNEDGEVNRYDLPANTKTTFLSKADLTPAGQSQPLEVRNFLLSADNSLILIYTN